MKKMKWLQEPTLWSLQERLFTLLNSPFDVSVLHHAPKKGHILYINSLSLQTSFAFALVPLCYFCFPSVIKSTHDMAF